MTPVLFFINSIFLPQLFYKVGRVTNGGRKELSISISPSYTAINNAPQLITSCHIFQSLAVVEKVKNFYGYNTHWPPGPPADNAIKLKIGGVVWGRGVDVNKRTVTTHCYS